MSQSDHNESGQLSRRRQARCNIRLGSGSEGVHPGDLSMSSRFAASLALALAAALAGCTLLPRKGTSSGRPADEGELGPLHAAHRDQIVFASQAIPRDGGLDVALAAMRVMLQKT
jgi:hypothetical protein